MFPLPLVTTSPYSKVRLSLSLIYASPSSRPGDDELPIIELLREYRKLDDSVMMRINRTNAQFRDRDRLLGASGKGNVQEEACAHLWQELVGALEKPYYHAEA
jgi:hypothetical protein